MNNRILLLIFLLFAAAACKAPGVDSNAGVSSMKVPPRKPMKVSPRKPMKVSLRKPMKVSPRKPMKVPPRKPMKVSLKEPMLATLKQLNAALLTCQEKDNSDPDFGALWCPHCKLYHTRGAEALYPFAYQYVLVGDTALRDAAIDLANWLVAQQQANGSWKETPEEWTGTTTDQLLMMSLAYPLLENDLKAEERSAWIRAMRAAGNYLVEVMDPGFASINYVASTSATMAVLNELLPDPRYKEKAQYCARSVVEKMDSDHFITGEGGRVEGVKYGVDLTYNMEMSLWGLALYAFLSGDSLVMDEVKASLERHLLFMNPDGSLDGSWGIRSNKWTCFGGATSDGSQVLFSQFVHLDPVYRTAALRNLAYLESCMVDGFVGYGPLHREVLGQSPCIYPTFAKAKNLALAHALCRQDTGPTPPLPSENMGFEHFPTLDVSRVRTKNFLASITAYSYRDPKGSKSKYMFRPTGGAISALWVEDYGFLQASSQTEYHRWEPMHFPEMSPLKTLTPRIEYKNKAGWYSNLYEFDAEMEYSTKGKLQVHVTGMLKNRDQVPCGIAYGYTYIFSDNAIEKHISVRSDRVGDTIRIIEPVILYAGTSVVQEDTRSVLISRGKQQVRFRLVSGKAQLHIGEQEEMYRSVYPALQACPLEITMPGEKDETGEKDEAGKKNMPGEKNKPGEIILEFKLVNKK